MKTATKEYVRPMSATWWLYNRQLVMFMIRELTAVFVGAYAIFLLVLLALDGNQFARVVQSPVALVLQIICLLFVLYHMYTWFALTPKAELIVFEPSAKEFKPLARYKVADSETYAYPVIAGNRVFVKDRDSLILWMIE